MPAMDDRVRVHLSAHAHPRVRIVGISGEIDARNAGDLSRRLGDIVAAAPPALILDVRGVEFLGVAGLRALLTVADDFAKANLRWALVTNNALELLLRVADRDHKLPAVDSMAQALTLTIAGPDGRPSPRVTPSHQTRC
jgi:anti-anti-sigma factor